MNREILERLGRVTEEEQAILDGQDGIDRKRYTDGEEQMVVDCEKLLEKGRLIQIRPHTRFAYFPKHRHNYIEVVYMCTGSTTHIIDGAEVVLKSGELLFLNRYAAQEVLPAGSGDIAVNFIVLPQFFDRAFEMLGNENNQFRQFLIECLLGKGEKYPGFLHFKVADVLTVQNLMENMVWSVLNNQPGQRVTSQMTMGLLFLHLMNYTDRIPDTERAGEQGLLFVVLRYIEDHYREASLAELARGLNYDLPWMSRRIKLACGKNFKELLQTKRLNRAEFLLRTTRIPVAEISAQVGYNNTSYFYRIFRERYGLSPREYRMENRKEDK